MHLAFTIRDALCYFHIENNVKAKCITDCRVKAKPTDAKVVEKEVKQANDEKHCDLVKKIVRVWREVVESPTEDLYASAWLKFKEVCEPFSMFVKYVETTVLSVKNQFVRAWTNKFLHPGCTTTNIVDSAHGHLKRYLRSSVGDLASCWDEIDKMLKNQLGEIQGSFGRSITVMKHKYKRHKLFSQFEGYVSRAALGFIDDELQCSRTLIFAKEDCGCMQMTRYGLPCACIIAEKRKKKLPILLDEIHPHWQRISVHGKEVDEHFSVMEEWNTIQERLMRAPYKMKLHIKEKLRELGFPEDTMLNPPPRKVVTKGAPKRGKVPKSKGERLGTYSRSQASTPTSKPKPYLNIPYISQIPMIVRPYSEDIGNVIGDDNCGFPGHN
ncbi:hypothetical protein MTR_3g467680 [Medicago truncatula]|uniref:Protein FAR1-RELATED SEQUENCE n=1 Tax=Medicago truncatula TaxID=3880 RepID=A0A072UY65_MEDTR|nr:hypothetical protein MTR_3g467680 [Medicago truncatula]